MITRQNIFQKKSTVFLWKHDYLNLASVIRLFIKTIKNNLFFIIIFLHKKIKIGMSSIGLNIRIPK